MKDPHDPIIRDAHKVDGEELSPMDPPDAQNPPSDIEALPREQLAPFLQELWDEHLAFVEKLTAFEAALASLRKDGISREAGREVSDFFQSFSDDFMPHHRKEERHLFPVLERALLEAGEHAKGPEKHTSVGLMEDDHAQAIQLAAVVFNFLGIASRLPDAASRQVVLDAALQQADSLVELLRLHIFRENNIIFPLAHRLIDPSVLRSLGS